MKSLAQNKNARSKKLLSMVSSLGNLNELNYTLPCKTEANVNQAENEYAKGHRLKIAESAQDLFKDKNGTKIKKYVDQSSSLFGNEIYGKNLNSKDF